ncbi:MAG: cupredoxin domain-containing protein [Actinobacteria bacterium]|nr:cupredoxin domain-containing protein [Actinomycetota bacterium]
MMPRILIPLALALVALGAPACGGGDGNGDGGGASGPVEIVLVDNAFQPTAITAAAGQEVVLSNEGQALHNLTIEGTDVDVDVSAGATETEDVLEGLAPGSYDIVCKYHVAEGMTGTLTIEG